MTPPEGQAGRRVKHNPRCAIFDEPPGLRDAKDCNCGAIPPLPGQAERERCGGTGKLSSVWAESLEAGDVIVVNVCIENDDYDDVSRTVLSRQDDPLRFRLRCPEGWEEGAEYEWSPEANARVRRRCPGCSDCAQPTGPEKGEDVISKLREQVATASELLDRALDHVPPTDQLAHDIHAALPRLTRAALLRFEDSE